MLLLLITKAFIDLDALEERRSAAQRKIKEIQKCVAEAEAEQNAVRLRVQERDRLAANREGELRNRLEKRAGLEARAEQRRKELAAYTEQIEELSENDRRADIEIKEGEEKLVHFEAQFEKLNLGASGRKETVAEAQLKNERAKRQRDSEALKSQWTMQTKRSSEARDHVFESAGNLLKQKNEWRRLQDELHLERQRRERIGGVRERQRNELKLRATDMAKMESVGKEAEFEADRLLAESSRRAIGKKEFGNEIRELRQAFEAQQRKKNELSTKLSVLRKLDAKGYLPWRGVRRALAAAGGRGEKFSELVEAVTDVITPKVGYERLCRLAIGKFLDGVVVKDPHVADELVAFLTEKKLGEATVLLTEHAGGTLPWTDEVGGHALVRGRVTQFVNIKDGYKDFAESILAGTYACAPWSEVHRAPLRALAKHARLITEDGVVVGPGNCIQGGFLDVSGDGELSLDSGEWNRLEKDLASVKVGMAALDKRLHERCRTEAENDGWIREHESLVCEAKVKFESSGRMKLQLHQDMTRLDKEVSLTETDLAECEEKEREHAEQIAVLESEVGVLEAAEQQAKDTLKEENDRLRILQDQKETAAEELTALNVQLQHWDVQEEANRKSQDALTSNVGLIRTVLEDKRRRREDGDAKKKNCVNKLAESKIELAEMDREIENGSALITELERELEGLRTERVDRQSATEKYHRHIAALREEEHALKLACTDIVHAQTNVGRHILEAYKTSLQELDRSAYTLPEGENLEDLNVRFEKLQTSVETFGAVNLLAVDEYEELNARYEFLTSQQEDLDSARRSLLEAIRKINRTTSKLFEDTFQQVQITFEQYYRILFKGGHAELILVDDSNPLDSGIDIHVRPPGKKLQHISLMSGGEKALTAIALLFALFKVKASPFCILDEVDAPLDEANIDRFLEVLDHFLDTTQFMIVTHNRKTIAAGQTLYGVTMEEMGVSTLVSVKVGGDRHSRGADQAQVNQSPHEAVIG